MALLGAHMSIAGGLYKAFERGEELGCEAIQIFPQSSRTWAIPLLSGEETLRFKTAREKAKGIRSVVAHNSYLLNLSTANREAREKSVAYFVTTMERCETLGIDALITHPGSHLGAGEEEGLRLTTQSLDEVLTACPGFRTRVLIENTAGQGGCVGCRFEHLEVIVGRLKAPERVGFCFDTQHAFAAGYDLRTPQAYAETMGEWDRRVGVARIEAFHLNDALKELGCRVDRHQNIGKGFLGTEAFRPLINDPRFQSIPMCLETDPGDDMMNWKHELQLLRGLRGTTAQP